MKKRAPGRSTLISSPSSRKADPTTAYATDLVAGKIVAGELAIAAAERHLRDLKDGLRRGLHWRPEAAMRALRFYPTVLTVTAGTLAGHPFNLLPWQLFVA